MNKIVNGISHSIVPNSVNDKPAISPGRAQADFANMLKSAIENINNAQLASDKKTEQLATGQIDDLHDVMITAQKASITLETSVQIQRKVIDAYNEIMRMQV